MVKVLNSQSRGPSVQNDWAVLRSTQPFILPGSIKWVPGISRELVLKSKLSPRSGSVALSSWTPFKKRAIMFFKRIFLLLSAQFSISVSLVNMSKSHRKVSKSNDPVHSCGTPEIIFCELNLSLILTLIIIIYLKLT